MVRGRHCNMAYFWVMCSCIPSKLHRMRWHTWVALKLRNKVNPWVTVFGILKGLETLEMSLEKTGHTQECLTSITVLKVTSQLKERIESCSWKIMLRTGVKNRVALFKLLGHWFSNSLYAQNCMWNLHTSVFTNKLWTFVQQR